MRKSILSILYHNTGQETDISEDIGNRLISFTYSDNKQGEADDIEITLQNRDGVLSSVKLPDKGATIKAGLELFDWQSQGERTHVSFGTFNIDEITADSRGVFTIKAIASICETAFKNEKKWKTWENVTLREIVTRIAADNNLQLIWKGQEGEIYKSLYQIEESDAEFILKKTADEGLKIKINEEKLVVYADSVGKCGVNITPEILINYSFKSKTFGVYDSCKVSYLSPETNQVYYAVYVDETKAKTKCLNLDYQARSYNEALAKAKSELKRHNEREITASIELPGTPEIWSDTETELSGFGLFSGNYLIESVKHTFGRNGYTTAADLVLKG